MSKFFIILQVQFILFFKADVNKNPFNYKFKQIHYIYKLIRPLNFSL